MLFNRISAAPHGMVYALMGEFSSHRTHLSTFLAVAKPIFVTRLILLSTQVCLAMHQYSGTTAVVLLSCMQLLYQALWYLQSCPVLTGLLSFHAGPRLGLWVVGVWLSMFDSSMAYSCL